MRKKIYKLGKNILLSPFVIADYLAFKKLDTNSRFKLGVRDFFPQIFDKTKLTGFDRHYVYHTTWAARKVAQIAPVKHVDIASSLYFPGIVSAFIPVDFYDYRPAPLHLSQLETKHADLTQLHFALFLRFLASILLNTLDLDATATLLIQREILKPVLN